MMVGHRSWCAVAMLWALFVGVSSASGQRLVVGGGIIPPFTARADTLNPIGVQFVGIASSDGSRVPFTFAGIRGVYCTGCGDERPPDFVVVSPSSGVTPAFVVVSLNPNVVPYLPSGTITFGVAFAKEGESCPACSEVGMVLRLSGSGGPSVTSVVNAATLQPGPIAPGEIVSIFGERLGTPPVSAQYDTGGQYSTKLGNSQVTFNGVAAPLLYVSTTQINAMVPWGVAGARTVDVVVARALGLLKSPPLPVPVADTAPGLFTVTGTGNGPGAFRSNGSLNGPNNPAPKGSVVEMWGTGAGEWSQLLRPDPLPLPFPDGSIFIAWNTLLAPTATPVTVTIGGQPARIQYSGPAPFQPIGVIQVNAFIPETVASGPQPVVLTIGQNSNAQQQVTVSVQ